MIRVYANPHAAARLDALHQRDRRACLHQGIRAPSHPMKTDENQEQDGTGMPERPRAPEQMISVRALLSGSPELLARINAKYPAPLYHLQELMPSHQIPAAYVAGFRSADMQAALALAVRPAQDDAHAPHKISAPIVDVEDCTAARVQADSLGLAHSDVKGWYLVAAEPIAAGSSLGSYFGDLTSYTPEADAPAAAKESSQQFLDRIIDSYPQAARLSLARREALRCLIRARLVGQSPYEYGISLPGPRPGAQPIRLLVDTMKRGSVFRFLSHDSTPNLRHVFCRDRQDDTSFIRIEFIAAKDIAMGEEFTIKYSYDEAEMAVDHENMQALHEGILAALG